MSEQQSNHKSQRWVRLQIKGGTEFNFVLPANPAWKISNLQQHMIKIYNQVTSNETSHLKAVQIRSLKRNGFYVAPSLKVGDVFNDWDEVSCHIVLKSVNDQGLDRSIQEEIKKNIQKNKNEHQDNKKKEINRKNSQAKQKEQKNNESKKQNNKKKDDFKKQQGSSSILSESKLIGIMEKIQNNKKTDQKNDKKSENKQEQKKETKKQTRQKTKSGAIIIKADSDQSN